MELLLDPLPALTARLGMALLFGTALLHKLATREAFARTVGNYLRGMGLGLRGPVLIGLAAVLVMLAEAAVVAGCLWPSSGVLAGSLAALVLAGYAAAMGLNLLRGNPLPDCGCSWGATPQPVRGGLIVRNLILAAAALLIAVPVAPRVPGLIDGVSAVLAVLIFALIYAAANHLLTLTTSTRGIAA